jgi:hypothetical protein
MTVGMRLLLVVLPLVVGVQVFSDVDDTLSCPSKTMRVFGAGVDKSFCRNLVSGSVIYPGIACLAVAFEKALNDSAPVRGLNILSARPQEAVNAGLMEIKADDPLGGALQRCGGGLDGKYYGTVQDVLTTGFSEEKRFIAFSKSKVTDLLGSVRKNESVVFMGDNGQGDLHAAVEMYKSLGAIFSAFIHRVNTAPALRVTEFGGAPIYFHYTAPGAGLVAYCAKFITRSSLQSIYSSAKGSDQNAACLNKCTPYCLGDDIDNNKCADSSCQADPQSGFPPGCNYFVKDMKAVETVLNQTADFKPDCDSILKESRVQFPPDWVAALSAGASRGSFWSFKPGSFVGCFFICSILKIAFGTT